jgi:predicted dehydrogenase
MPDLPRIAVIGLGVFGKLHAEHLTRLGGVELSAFAEPDRERREAAAKEFATARAFETVDALIAAQAADAVIIATRANTHASIAVRAMEAGLHVFVEKPAAETEEELETMINARLKTGCVAMVDHICLFHSLVTPLITRVRETGFRAVNFMRHRPAALAARLPEAHPLTLLMVHDLTIAACMVGVETPVEWDFMESCGPNGTVDMTWATLRWADGRTATFQSHCTLPTSAPSDGWDTIEVFGNGYHSHVQTNPAPWSWQGAQPEWPIALEISNVQGRPTGMLAEAQRSFINAIQGTPVPEGCRLEDALLIERWMTKIRQSR